MTALADRPSIRAGVEAGIEWRLLLAPTGGFVNGYVRLPVEHPWRGLDYGEVPVEVHGGLTYADQDGWIGFDTAHAWDIWTETALRPAATHRADWAFPWRDGDPWNRFWTLEQVQAETEQLARQTAAALTTTVGVTTAPQDQQEEPR